MKLITTEKLPKFEYYYEKQKAKTQVVLHHTVSAVGKFVDDWFKADHGKSKVAVPYVIDKNGDILELFNDSYWAWHIGRGSNMLQNKRSIGIELVNEGPLFKRSDGKFYWWIDENNPQGKVEYKGDVFELEEEWRGYKYFASYTPQQVDSLLELLEHIFAIYSDIPRRCVDNFDYDRKNLDYNGVVMHCNLRKDKTDLSPAFDISVVHEMLLSLAHMDIEPKAIERIPYVAKEIEFIEEQKVAEKAKPFIKKSKKKETSDTKSGFIETEINLHPHDVSGHPKPNTM